MSSNTKKKSLNLPTILTILRIVLVIPVVICIFIDELPAQIATVICFALASITDFVDGKIARKNNQVTDLGAFLDPLADKMLVNLTFVALVTLGLVPFWMFAVILIRDFIVDGLRMMAAKKDVTLAASKFGKLKTLVQMVTVTLILLNVIINNDILAIINTVLLYIVIVLTVFSGIDYLINGRKLML